MIVTIVAGVGFIVLVAIVVGIVDAVQAPARRLTAADRRQNWEARQLEFHGVDATDVDNWDDD